jgi:DNA-binding NarL/FixJ family response regulator
MTGALIRVLLADDSAVVRKGVALLLSGEGDLRLVGTARNGREAVAMAAALRPDVILMDIAMPVMNGEAATRLILAADPRIQVVALTAHADSEYVECMAAAGAAGFVSKHGRATLILTAVRACAAGKIFFGPWATGSPDRPAGRCSPSWPGPPVLRPGKPVPAVAAGKLSSKSRSWGPARRPDPEKR